MTTLEERVAYLEGRIGEHSRMIDGIREAIVRLEQRMDQRFASIDRRFESIDRRFATIDTRFTALELKLDQGLDRLDAKMSRQFLWLVGILVTTLVATTAAMIAR